MAFFVRKVGCRRAPARSCRDWDGLWRCGGGAWRRSGQAGPAGEGQSSTGYFYGL